MNNRSDHLKLIQDAIGQQKRYSFFVRLCSAVLVSVLLAVSTQKGKYDFGFIALFPAILFWGLDAWYYREHQLLTALYEEVKGKQDDEIDFSMSTKQFENKSNKWEKILFVTPIIFIHLCIFIAIFVVLGIFEPVKKTTVIIGQ